VEQVDMVASRVMIIMGVVVVDHILVVMVVTQEVSSILHWLSTHNSLEPQTTALAEVVAVVDSQIRHPDNSLKNMTQANGKNARPGRLHLHPLLMLEHHLIQPEQAPQPKHLPVGQV
jgi:hypothetical protein